MSGSARFFNNFFTSSGAQRWAWREIGNINKNTATLIQSMISTYDSDITCDNLRCAECAHAN